MRAKQTTAILSLFALAVSGCGLLNGGGSDEGEESDTPAALDVSDEVFLDVSRCISAKTRLSGIFDAVAQIESDETRGLEIAEFAHSAEVASAWYDQLRTTMREERPMTDDQIRQFDQAAASELDGLEANREIDEFGGDFARIGDTCDTAYRAG